MYSKVHSNDKGVKQSDAAIVVGFGKVLI